MIITYKTAKGAETTIIDETSNHIHITVGDKIVITFDAGDKTLPTDPTALTLYDSYHAQANSDHREARRHCGLSLTLESGEDCESKYLIDPCVDVEKTVMDKLAHERLQAAVARLKPEQQQILYALYLSSKPKSQSEYARELGISQAAVSQRLKTAEKKLKEILSKTL